MQIFLLTYSKLFRSIFEGVLNTLVDEKHEECEPNPYWPGIVTFLLENYMPIFPLWSGILLGDLKRYSVDLAVTLLSHKDLCQTRDTNCHAENWFGIVKNVILCRKRDLRPAEFITLMYNSLKEQYKEYILSNTLPQDVLTRPTKSSKDVSFAEERWAKRSGKRGNEHPAISVLHMICQCQKGNIHLNIIKILLKR